MCIRDRCNGEDAQAERRQQVAQDFKAELHLIGVYDHGRDHDVDQQIGQRLFVFQLQEMCIRDRFQMMNAPAKGFSISVADPADVTGFLHYMLEAGRKDRAC